MRCLVYGVQCLVMSELKQIRVLSLKSLIIASLLWSTKQLCKAQVGAQDSDFKSLKMD